MYCITFYDSMNYMDLINSFIIILVVYFVVYFPINWLFPHILDKDGHFDELAYIILYQKVKRDLEKQYKSKND